MGTDAPTGLADDAPVDLVFVNLMAVWARLLYAVDVSPKESVPRGVAMASYTIKVVTILAVACLSMSHTVSISLRPQRSSHCKRGLVLRVYDGSYYEAL